MNNTTSFTKMHNEMIKLRERAERAEGALAEAQAILAKMLEQKPVAYLDYWKSDGTGIVRKQRTTGVPFFNSPVPAPATECRGIPGRGCQYLAACNIPCNKCGKVHNAMFSLTPTPFIPDDDTRRNDEAFAAQQAATAPSVPDVLIQLRDKVTRIPHRTEYLSGQQFAYVRLCEVVGEIEAMLQSANHSEG